MAVLNITVPDEHVADLAEAIAYRMTEDQDPNIRLIANAIIAGEPTTGAQKKALAEAYSQRAMKRAWAEWRSQKAAEERRSQDDATLW